MIKRNILFTLLKIVICVFLIKIILTKFDIKKVVETVRQIDISVFVLVFLSFAMANFFILMRWILILKYLDVDVKFSIAAKSYLIGFFLNLFLPTSVGGDVFKAYYLSKNLNNCRMEKSLFSVFFDRYIGLLVMLIVAVIGSIFLNIKIGYIELSKILFVLFGILFFFNLFIIFYADRLDRMFNKVRFLKNRFSNVFGKISEILIFSKKSKGLFLCIITLSLCSLLMFCFMHYVFIYMVGRISAFLAILVFVPVTMIFAMIPISISGIGLREFSYITLFQTLNVDPAISIAMSISFYFSMLIFAIPGAFCFVISGKGKL